MTRSRANYLIRLAKDFAVLSILERTNEKQEKSHCASSVYIQTRVRSSFHGHAGPAN